MRARSLKPRVLIPIGVGLLLVGGALPFLMVSRIIESRIWLSILAYCSSVAGLVVGMVGVARYLGSRPGDRF